MTSAPPIPGTEEVMAALGYWPSFHDAEVLAFTMSRGKNPTDYKSEARIEVHVKEYAPRHEGTAQFEMSIVKNVIISFVFTDVESLQVEDFNFQNVINSIRIEQDISNTAAGKLRVEVESIYGFGATWLCKSAQVAGVSKLAASEA
jgi:hypothetical protein